MKTHEILNYAAAFLWLACFVFSAVLERRAKKYRQEAEKYMTDADARVRKLIHVLPTEILRVMLVESTGRLRIQINAELYNREHSKK